MNEMFRLDQVHVRVSEVASVRIDRGHSYTRLIVRMKDGHEFVYLGNQIYDVEAQLLAAIEAQALAARADRPA